jgi:hypothetical protein
VFSQKLFQWPEVARSGKQAMANVHSLAGVQWPAVKEKNDVAKVTQDHLAGAVARARSLARSR